MHSLTTHSVFFFFNDPAPPEISPLPLHAALPIPFVPAAKESFPSHSSTATVLTSVRRYDPHRDRKSTRLNSSHGYISYAVFCLKKKKTRGMYAKHLHAAGDCLHSMVPCTHRYGIV